LDEFRREYAESSRVAILRNAYDRTFQGKGVVDDPNSIRKVIPRTTPIVCGETQIDDPATQSRYFHVLISNHKRKPDPGGIRFAELSSLPPHLPILGRTIMERRKAFTERFLLSYADFKDVAKAELKGEDITERSFNVHASAYAGLDAANFVLGGGLTKERMLAFAKYLVNYTLESDKSFSADKPTDSFLNEAMVAITLGEATFYRTVWMSEDGKRKVKDSHPGARMCIAFHKASFYAEMEIFMRKRGSQKDILKPATLTSYLSQEKNYWVRILKINSKKWNSDCWILDPEGMPNSDYWIALAKDASADAREKDDLEALES
jgi:hypothetical protein